MVIDNIAEESEHRYEIDNNPNDIPEWVHILPVPKLMSNYSQYLFNSLRSFMLFEQCVEQYDPLICAESIVERI